MTAPPVAHLVALDELRVLQNELRREPAAPLGLAGRGREDGQPLRVRAVWEALERAGRRQHVHGRARRLLEGAVGDEHLGLVVVVVPDQQLDLG